jgi:hypothetical protein
MLCCANLLLVFELNQRKQLALADPREASDFDAVQFALREPSSDGGWSHTSKELSGGLNRVQPVRCAALFACAHAPSAARLYLDRLTFISI